jgi:enoyl-CoA hydratase/carnithine racemase
MMAKTVLSDYLGDGVQKISLNRPHRLNAIVPELLEDLNAALDAANDDAKVGAIVLTGEGRAFCAGDDLKEFKSEAESEEETTAYIERIQDVTRAIMLGKRPVVGAIRGWAAGGGLEWVINCDFALAAKGTRFFFPEIALGVFVTGGVTELLPRLVGLARAREMIMLGEKFDADQAKSWGLIREVVADEALFPQALGLAKRLALLPRERVADLRRILARPDKAGLEATMALETAATVKGFRDPETVRRVGEFR